MGPRSHERGNTVDRQFNAKPYTLQWGRVLMNAETRYGCGKGRWPCRASMGPRSHERGNALLEDVTSSLCDASMGPRSHERGNLRLPARPTERGKRFNGAAFS